jgi:hypothetical protein
MRHDTIFDFQELISFACPGTILHYLKNRGNGQLYQVGVFIRRFPTDPRISRHQSKYRRKHAGEHGWCRALRRASTNHNPCCVTPAGSTSSKTTSPNRLHFFRVLFQSTPSIHPSPVFGSIPQTTSDPGFVNGARKCHNYGGWKMHSSTASNHPANILPAIVHRANP